MREQGRTKTALSAGDPAGTRAWALQEVPPFLSGLRRNAAV
ncbi:hypothetical protein [Streptomyces sp. WMMB 322]|nr:hypothetical protein [Streptomyces sp. WMMB 322]SCK50440.1 hypothetical protein H180DRAFT_04558 [Streptomyces sp. WMMB 322]